MNRIWVFIGLLMVVGIAAFGEPRGHAHNDYRHERPLLDALEHGFASVEADIFLVDGTLLVAHDLKDTLPERTLESLYLEPLQRWVAAHDGKVQPGLEQFVLLIDIKADGEAVYRALKAVLEKYREILTTVVDGKVVPGPVVAILSGAYPLDTVASETSRLVAIDGRPHHLGQGYAVDLMPLISDNWYNHFKWVGNGPMPEEQRNAMRALVQRAHDEGRMVRFWATPDRPEVWREEFAAGVDLINADNLARFAEFVAVHDAAKHP